MLENKVFNVLSVDFIFIICYIYYKGGIHAHRSWYEDSEQDLFFFPTRGPIPRIRSAGLYLVSHLAALNVDFNTKNLYAKKYSRLPSPVTILLSNS